MTHTTREEWLQSAAAHLAERVFAPAGYPAPVDVKVSCSWPGGGSARKRLGECWPRAYSAAKVNEIFISPTIADPIAALDILAHELVHSLDDCVSGHKKAFVEAARAIGLEGKPTATHAGPQLVEKLRRIVEHLGAYPHATVSLAGRKKQSTRMIKVECGDCGGVFRTTQKWIDEAEHDLCCPFCRSEAVKTEGGDEEA